MENKYELKTLDDILTIPSDRLDTFFAEFIPHVKGYREAKELIELLGVENIPEGEKAAAAITLKSMTWIDDGKKGVTTNLTIRSAQGE